MDTLKFLNKIYTESIKLVGSQNKIKSKLDKQITDNLDVLLEFSEKRKGVFTVLFTSLVYKTLNPQQDVRKHQAGMNGGYSGRTFDTNFITPFLQEKRFPAPSETGWLTRSLETNNPYNLDYKPNITPKTLKGSFLYILDKIHKDTNSKDCLLYLLQGLLIQRNNQKIDLAKPHNLPISIITNLLEKHFNSNYSTDGAARLPVLALYAIYECLVVELRRFENKKLLPIESHTSADSRSGRIGDVDVVDENNKPFEAVEVKHGIEITLQMVKNTFDKFSKTQVERYYILSTADIKKEEQKDIEKEIERVKNIHGCHLIVNGINRSLNYYLRLLTDSSEFIDKYVTLVEDDHALKFEHKKRWNEIISEM